MKLRDLSGFLGSMLVDPHFRHTPVVKTTSRHLKVESGSLGSLKGWGKIAVFSSWSGQPIMSRSLSRYLFELEEIGYRSLVVSTSSFPEALLWPEGKPESAVVTRRENLGYDFGSWASALAELPWISKAPRVLLTNDSMVGPFDSLERIAEASKRSSADIFALTESKDIAHHPQSFFLEFRDGILDDEPWKKFFGSIRPQDEKMNVVRAYEIQVGEWAVRHGYSWEPMITSWMRHSGLSNPTLESFKLMLDHGIPFVKRNILAEEAFWQTSLSMKNQVLSLYNENVEDWLPLGYSLPETRIEGGK